MTVFLDANCESNRPGLKDRVGIVSASLMVERAAPETNGMIERFQTIEHKPASIDEATRSIAVVAATESPSMVYDPERWETLNEILLMSGCQIPEENSIPLTVQHSRDAQDVIGSLREMKIEKDELLGRVYYSAAEDAESFWIKSKEGHLKRFSITYPASGRESVYIAENQTATVMGKTYTGPLLVTTKWQPKALGLVLFAADDRATARAASNHENKKEKDTMDPKLRKFLERSGLPATATEAEAWTFMETLNVQREKPSPNAPDPEAAPHQAAAPKVPAVNNGDVGRSEELVIRQERERIMEIHALCDRFGLTEMAGKAVTEGKTVAQVQAEVLKEMAERQDPGYRPAQVITDERDKFRSAAEDGLMIRSGIVIEKPAMGAADMSGWSLLEMARHALIVSNKPSGGNKLEMVGRALTTTDFPLLLANVANKSLFAGWEGAQETWSQWCATGSVSDFKTQYLPRLSETEDLDEMPEGMEYKYGKRAEAQESFSIATYGKMLAITRQTIINDDLMSMTDIPKAHGEAAARKVGDLPYAVLTANAAMGDGNALFSTAHANYVASGSGAIPGVSTIAAGILAMGIQKDLMAKRRLNIRPAYFLGPKALEGAAEVFFRTDRFSDANTVATDSSFASTRVNPYSGTVLTRVYDARLDDDDVAAWYLAASKGRTVTVYFLDGQQKPYMETRQGWNVDGVEYKVRIDAGAKAVDWKGLYYNDGN